MTTNNAPTAEQIADIVREHLTAAYVCNRVWEAWYVGTMGQEDFVEASETDMADEIAAAIVERFGRPAMPADAEDAERYRAMRKAATENDRTFLDAASEYGEKNFADYENPTEDEFDACVDHARRRIEGES